MRKLYLIVILFVFIILSGCKPDIILPRRREIKDLALVRVVGIDKSEEHPNGFMITTASKRLGPGADAEIMGSGKKNETGQGKSVLLTAEGKTEFEAVRHVQIHSDKQLFWGHVDYFLIGEEAAKENINRIIDFFTRDHEFRIKAKIYIVRGSTAKELMEQINKTEQFIVEKLDSLGQNIKVLSTSEEMKMWELIRFLDVHGSSARVPSIYLSKQQREGTTQNLYVESNGYAILKDFKLVSFIDRDISRGINLITNKLWSSVVVLKDPWGNDVSLEIVSSNTEVIPHFNGDSLEKVTLKTKVISNLDEIQSQIKGIEEDFIQSLEKKEAEILKAEMEKALKKVLEYESDCLGICDRISLSSPLKWQKIKDRWHEIFTQLQYEIQVDAQIERTYELNETSGYAGRE